jgi:N-acetylglucosamine-6-sulfatase
MSPRSVVLSIVFAFVVCGCAGATTTQIPTPSTAVTTDMSQPQSANRVALAEDPANYSQPNIVVVMLDDFAAMDRRIFERLPNIKSLFLDQGLELTNYWGNDPLCCPGRAAFLSGQTAHVNGIVDNKTPTALDASETVATELQSSGYHTLLCGKYLNHSELLPDKLPDGWSHAALMSDQYYGYDAWVDGVYERHGFAEAHYQPDVFGARCVNFLQQAPPENPLFMWYTPYTTHAGKDIDKTRDRYEPVPAVRYRTDERCNSIPAWYPANYNISLGKKRPAYVRARPALPTILSTGYPMEKRCRALLATDEWVGKIASELKAQGRFDNTLFILTSDNGMGWGSLRWERKWAPHTAQMPFFAYWPAVMGTTSFQNGSMLTNVDIAPTLCEFAGCTMGPYPNGHPADGQSFAGLINPSLSSAVPRRTSIVLEEKGTEGMTPLYRGIMTDPVQHSVRKQWLYVSYATGEEELYNLSGGPCWLWRKGMPGDPCMLNNKADAGASASLKAQLAAELVQVWDSQ